ncbi:unnamed protein product, partial [Iphiclides podalirius]
MGKERARSRHFGTRCEEELRRGELARSARPLGERCPLYRTERIATSAIGWSPANRRAQCSGMMSAFVSLTRNLN